MNKKSLIIYAVALILVIAVSVWAYNYMSSSYEVPETTDIPQSVEKQIAPDFSVKDGEGNTVRLSDFKGKPVVLNFWATWCNPCRSEFPSFEKMYNKYVDDIEFVMVDMTDGQRETMEDAKRFISNNGYTFPVYYDTELEAAYVYSVNSIPMTVFIDSNGNLINYHTGAMNDTTLEKYIKQLQEAE